MPKPTSGPEAAPLKAAPSEAHNGAEQTVPAPWPEDITLLRSRDALKVSFDNGDCFTIGAELLRVESPSAEVQGHGGPATKVLITGKSGVRITGIEPVGRYAVRLIFDDGHDTGYYTWDLLHRLGRDGAAIRADYDRRVAARQGPDSPER